MLTVLFAGSTAVLFGAADFLGGLASRRDAALVVTATAHAVSVLLLVVVALVYPSEMVTRVDLLAGAVAGVLGGLGVAALYAGLAIGRMSVVAPLTAALSGSLPAVYDVVTGGRLTWLDGAGLLLALGAIIMVSISSHPDDPHGMPPAAIVFSLLAGVGFAASFIAFSFTAEPSGMWPLVSARVVSAVCLSAAAGVRYRRVLALVGVRKSAIATGVLDSAANVTMLLAIRTGQLAIASMLGSLYPVVTVLAAFVILRERVTGLQRVGIIVALGAVLLTAL